MPVFDTTLGLYTLGVALFFGIAGSLFTLFFVSRQMKKMLRVLKEEEND